MSTSDLTAARLLADGGRLLAAVAGNSPVTFQTFDESPARRSSLTRILHGTLAEHASHLADLNDAGASINFMVNQGDGRGRSKAHVLAVRAAFVDLDGAPIDPVLQGPLKPHAIVRSSPGRFHAYWVVEGVHLEDFKPLQQSIAARFGGDRTVVDLPRVMRLPGSMHRKRDPLPCELVQLDAFGPYSRATLLEAFEPQPGPQKASAPKLTVVDGSIPEGERNSQLFALARGLVNKGFAPDQVLDRIQRVNVSKCAVPLCAKEVDGLVASAVEHGPAGHLNLPLAVVDSPTFRGLSHAARTLALGAYRRYNGYNNSNISLPFQDFRVEFTRKETFYKARSELVRSGLIRVARKQRCSGLGGWEPDLFAVPAEPASGTDGSA